MTITIDSQVMQRFRDNSIRDMIENLDIAVICCQCCDKQSYDMQIDDELKVTLVLNGKCDCTP